MRIYFYKDEKGVIQKYAYCSTCGAGPFKQSEINVKFVEKGIGRPLLYCMSCTRILRLSHVTLPIIEDMSDITDLDIAPIKELIFKKKKDPTAPKKPRQRLFSESSTSFKGPFFAYIAQGIDDSYTCGVTKDLQKESKEVNNGKAPRNSKPPLEIVYYKSEENEENAQRIRDILSKYKRDKKEQLISIFEKQFFAS